MIFSNIFSKFRSKKVLLVSVIVLVVLILVFKGSGNNTDTSFEVKKGEFVKSVSVSGKVIATQSVDMGFEISGTVARVYKDVGQTVVSGEAIVVLNSSELQASRDKANANLLAESAELKKLQSIGADSTKVQNNKRLLVNSILDAYTDADDAIRNKVDQFFTDGRSDGPKIKYTFSNYFGTKDRINSERKVVETLLVNWKKDIESLSIDNYSDSFVKSAFTNLLKVKSFLDMVSFAVNSYEESDVLTLSMIEKYRSDIATARSNVNNSVSGLTSASDDFQSILSDVPVQEARVRAAEAEVRSIDAQIAKATIRAPFNGIVSLNDAKVGESVNSNDVLVSVVSNDLEIEAFIPEVNIGGIALQNKVTVDFDAIPNLVGFEAYVSHIDPAQTEKDGVSNYKIKVKPAKQNMSIKPGMTANITIETERKSEVISIPKKFVSTDDFKVLVMKGNEETEEKIVTIGEDDGKGNVEILSGLNEGDVLVLPTLTP